MKITTEKIILTFTFSLVINIIGTLVIGIIGIFLFGLSGWSPQETMLIWVIQWIWSTIIGIWPGSMLYKKGWQIAGIFTILFIWPLFNLILYIFLTYLLLFTFILLAVGM